MYFEKYEKEIVKWKKEGDDIVGYSSKNEIIFRKPIDQLAKEEKEA